MNESVFDCRRRRTVGVKVGNIEIGGGHPVVVQSMTSTSTMDTAGSVAQAIAIADAGGELVRLTAQGVREADNLAEIRAELRRRGYETPLAADIHFNRNAAFAAAKNVEKVRINPGNFVDPGRTFRKIEFSDEEYAAELEKIEREFAPLLELCKEHSTALRIGVNHGSLSDRIMSRYGDTPEGMAESAMEFLRVCVAHGFKDVVISVKASNTVVMVETARRLVAAMDKEDMHFPLHLGVTEAGDSEDGRIKSAVGIGTLMADGIGDTIRVSLSESPENEIPVARRLTRYFEELEKAPSVGGVYHEGYDPFVPKVREVQSVTGVYCMPGEAYSDYDGDRQPDGVVADGWEIVDSNLPLKYPKSPTEPIVIFSTHANQSASILARLHAYVDAGVKNPVIVKLKYDKSLDYDDVVVRASADLGRILLAGFADGVMIDAPTLTAGQRASLAFGILQASRRRFTRTEYIACPGCGRTLFDLHETLARVKAATKHLNGLKIGVMGCIVNGPGEMADADYGYVGAGVGKVSLYKGKTCVEKNIPQEQAIDRLLDLLKSDGIE